MIPNFPKFKNLSLEDKTILSPYLMSSENNICNLTFANLFIWREWYETKLTRINGNICVLMSPVNEKPYFLKPLEDNNVVETVETCLSHVSSINFVDKTFANLLSNCNLRITRIDNNFDYVYKINELAEFRGKKFDGKRNHINKFRRKYKDFEFVPISEDHLDRVIDIYYKWLEPRKGFSPWKESLQYLNYDEAAFTNLLRNAGKLNVYGGMARVNGEACGFIVGTPVNDETMCVHFQHAYPNIGGIYQVLLNEACKTVFSGFRYINLEDDAGSPGLKKAKMSYYPVRLEEKFTITKEGT